MSSAIRDDVCSGLDISTDVIQIRLLYSIACTTIWTSVMEMPFYMWHDDVIKWKHFPRYWPFVRGIHRSPVNSPHKGQWHGALVFSLICIWINDWVNNREAGDLRLIKGIPGTKLRHYIIQAQWTHSGIITSFLRQNDIATSFWRKIDVIVASYVRWEDFNGKFEKTDMLKTYHICMDFGKRPLRKQIRHQAPINLLLINITTFPGLFLNTEIKDFSEISGPMFKLKTDFRK